MKITRLKNLSNFYEIVLICSMLFLSIINCQELSLNGNIEANKNFYCGDFLTTSLLSKSIETKLVKTEKISASKIEARVINVDKIVSGNKDSVIYFHSFIKIKGKLRYSNDQCYKDENKSSFIEIDNLVIKNSKQFQTMKKFKDIFITNENDFSKKIIIKENTNNSHVLLEIKLTYNKLFLDGEQINLKLNGNVIYSDRVIHSDEKKYLEKLNSLFSTKNSDNLSNNSNTLSYLYKTIEIKKIINLNSNYLKEANNNNQGFIENQISIGLKNYNLEDKNDFSRLSNKYPISENLKDKYKLFSLDIKAFIR